MFGTVFAMLNTSACRPTPSAAASSTLRTKPLIRETTVPAAITALEVSSELESSAPASRLAVPGCSWAVAASAVAHCLPRPPAAAADPQHDAAHDHHDEQQRRRRR